MTREEMISGLKFTVEMCLFDPSTGEEYTEPRNDMDKITIDACRGAIKALEQEHLYIDKPRGYQAHSISDEKICDYYDPEVKTCRRSEVPPKTGHWIEENMFDGDIAYRCSECDEPFCLIDGTPTDNMYNFCPNCGAKMESEDKK